jgi:hypothetical protein
MKKRIELKLGVEKLRTLTPSQLRETKGGCVTTGGCGLGSRYTGWGSQNGCGNGKTGA